MTSVRDFFFSLGSFPSFPWGRWHHWHGTGGRGGIPCRARRPTCYCRSSSVTRSKFSLRKKGPCTQVPKVSCDGVRFLVELSAKFAIRSQPNLPVAGGRVEVFYKDGDETPPAPTTSHRQGQGGHRVGAYKTTTVAWPNVARAPPNDPRIYVSLKAGWIIDMRSWADG
jgi:hypothetical protein